MGINRRARPGLQNPTSVDYAVQRRQPRAWWRKPETANKISTPHIADFCHFVARTTGNQRRALPFLTLRGAATEQFIQRNVASDIFMAPRQFTRRHDPRRSVRWQSAYPGRLKNHSDVLTRDQRLPRLNV